MYAKTPYGPATATIGNLVSVVGSSLTVDGTTREWDILREIHIERSAYVSMYTDKLI